MRWAGKPLFMRVLSDNSPTSFAKLVGELSLKTMSQFWLQPMI